MQSRNFTINTIDNVKKLVNVASKFVEDIDLVKGRYVIDCKSLMGVFSLDLSQPVEVCIHTEDTDRADEFFKEVEEVLA